MTDTRFEVSASTVQGLVQGDHNTVTLNFASDYGASAAPARAPAGPRRIPAPVALLPPAFVGFLDRYDELRAVVTALAAGEPVEVVGWDGAGKTALLRVVARHQSLPSYPDGTVYREHRGESAADFVQALFESFYETPGTIKLSETRLRQHLGVVRALLLLDNLDLPRESVEAVRNAVASCTVVTASRALRSAGEGRMVSVGPLPIDAALQLFQRRCGRELAAGELPAARAVCEALGGHPLAIVRAGSLAAVAGLPLSELAGRLPPHDASAGVTRDLVAALPPESRAVLGALAGVEGAAVPVDRAAEVAADPAAPTLLAHLEELGLVASHSPRYTLTAGVADVVGPPPRSFLERVATAPGRDGDHELDLAALVASAREGRWASVIGLARSLDASLAGRGRWDAWETVLANALAAAHAAGDASAEAWALHQLGTRRLALEQYDGAGELLDRALAAREAIGEDEGAELTRANLATLAALAGHLAPEASAGGSEGRPEPPGQPPWAHHEDLGRVAAAAGRPARRWLLAVLVVVAVATAVVVGVVVAGGGGDDPPRPEATTTAVVPGLSLVPFEADVAQGAAASVTIEGSGFGADPVVSAGDGVSVVLRQARDTTIVAVFRASPDARPGARDVTVTAAGGGSASCPGCLTVTLPPVITAVSPDAIAVGGSSVVTVSGSGFDPGAEVGTDYRFAAVERARGFQSGAITVRVTPHDGARVGDCIEITVRNPDGGFATSPCLRVAFGGILGPLPTIG